MTDGGLQDVFIYRHLFPPFFDYLIGDVINEIISREGEEKGVFIKKVFKPFFNTIT